MSLATGQLQACAAAPCKSCPYRKDVPSGVWAAEEYDRLPAFDGEISDQLTNGGTFLFGCHQDDGNLCAGWVAAHGAGNLLALRLHSRSVAASVWAYESPVPVFSTGREAAEHGKRDIDGPSEIAERTIARIVRRRGL